MPLAAIAAIASIASAGVGIGSTIYNDVSQPSQQQQQPSATSPTAAPVPTAQENIATETAKRMQEAMLINKQKPGLQESGSGGYSPDYSNQLGAQLAGVFGSNPSTVNPTSSGGYLGLGGGGDNSGGGGGLMDMISSLQTQGLGA